MNPRVSRVLSRSVLPAPPAPWRMAGGTRDAVVAAGMGTGLVEGFAVLRNHPVISDGTGFSGR
jgi:hypothetical protein